MLELPVLGSLENARDGGAWWAAIYGVARSRTQLKRLSSSSSCVSVSHSVNWAQQSRVKVEWGTPVACLVLLVLPAALPRAWTPSGRNDVNPGARLSIFRKEKQKLKPDPCKGCTWPWGCLLGEIPPNIFVSGGKERAGC